jgi:hypothetical protein
MHDTVLFVAMEGVANRKPVRLDGAFSGDLGAALGCLGPLFGGERILLMAVHGVIFPTAGSLGRDWVEVGAHRAPRFREQSHCLP